MSLRLAITVATVFLVAACQLEHQAAVAGEVRHYDHGNLVRSWKLDPKQLVALTGWFDLRSSGWSPSVVSFAPVLEVRLTLDGGKLAVVNIRRDDVVIYGDNRQFQLTQGFLAADLATLREIVGGPNVMPNPAVKRTNIGGAHLLASLASSTPLFVAYLFR